MKKTILLVVAALLCVMQLRAQENSADLIEQAVENIYGMNPNFEISLGYAPKAPFNAVKTTVAINNVLFKRIGFYTSVEIGTESDPVIFSNYRNNRFVSQIIGGNITITPWLYVWGGMDLFTKSGVFEAKEQPYGPRTEFGIGLTPYKWLVTRIGFSKSVVGTLTIGGRIPIGR